MTTGERVAWSTGPSPSSLQGVGWMAVPAAGQPHQHHVDSEPSQVGGREFR